MSQEAGNGAGHNAALARWQGQVEARLDALEVLANERHSIASRQTADLRHDLEQIRDHDARALTREQYDAQHSELYERVNLFGQQLANYQGRAIVIASLAALVIAGAISAIANHL